MLQVNNLVGFGAKDQSAGGITLTYIDSYNIADTSRTTYNFTSCDMGNGGHVVVVIGETQDRESIDSVTINGESATIHIQTDQTATQATAGIASAESVGSGTGKTVSVTFSGNCDDVGIHIYVMAGYSSATPHHTAQNDSNSGNNLSVPLNTPAGGVMVGGSVHKDNKTDSWTGLLDTSNGAVEDFNGLIGGTKGNMCVRHRTGLSSETAASCAATLSSNNYFAAAVASWI